MHPYKNHPIAKTVEWLTPLEIINSLGPFDLDPCSPIVRPWDTAKVHYDSLVDGLSTPWAGRVWLNPPYGNETGKWLARLAEHGDGIALVFARTETKMFFESVWGRADAVLFLRGRPHFHFPDGSRAKGNSGGPLCLIAYGYKNRWALDGAAHLGRVVLA